MSAVVGIAIAALIFVGIFCWFLLFPETMGRLRERVSNCLKSRRSAAHNRRGVGGISASVSASESTQSGSLSSFFSRHGRVLALALGLVAVPSLVILMMRQTVVLADFQGDDFSESGSMVAQLLRGERLTPPPPPPPEVFTTQEVRRLHPEIVTADRKWQQIDPGLQQRVLAIYEVMRRQHGYEMVLVEGYRSPERQAELMAGGKATRAGAWQSCHQYGLGVDSALIRDGKLQWDMADAWTHRGYFLYGELAEQAGLEWGGNWRSIKDYVHLEMSGKCKSARAAKRAELARQG